MDLKNATYRHELDRTPCYNSTVDCVRSTKLFDKRIWRVEDVALFTGYAQGTIYNFVSDEKIPKRKKRGILFFIPEEISNWFLEGD